MVAFDLLCSLNVNLKEREYSKGFQMALSVLFYMACVYKKAVYTNSGNWASACIMLQDLASKREISHWVRNLLL